MPRVRLAPPATACHIAPPLSHAAIHTSPRFRRQIHRPLGRRPWSLAGARGARLIALTARRDHTVGIPTRRVAPTWNARGDGGARVAVATSRWLVTAPGDGAAHPTASVPTATSAMLLAGLPAALVGWLDGLRLIGRLRAALAAAGVDATLGLRGGGRPRTDHRSRLDRPDAFLRPRRGRGRLALAACGGASCPPYGSPVEEARLSAAALVCSRWRRTARRHRPLAGSGVGPLSARCIIDGVVALTAGAAAAALLAADDRRRSNDARRRWRRSPAARHAARLARRRLLSCGGLASPTGTRRPSDLRLHARARGRLGPGRPARADP